MPIYEYGCSACEHKFEEQQKIADPPLVTCPACGQDKLIRLISCTAFMLKGGGWEKDGYAKGKNGKRSDNQVTDSLQKAVDKDKKKEAASATSSDSSKKT